MTKRPLEDNATGSEPKKPRSDDEAGSKKKTAHSFSISESDFLAHASDMPCRLNGKDITCTPQVRLAE